MTLASRDQNIKVLHEHAEENGVSQERVNGAMSSERVHLHAMSLGSFDKHGNSSHGGNVLLKDTTPHKFLEEDDLLPDDHEVSATRPSKYMGRADLQKRQSEFLHEITTSMTSSHDDQELQESTDDGLTTSQENLGPEAAVSQRNMSQDTVSKNSKAVKEQNVSKSCVCAIGVPGAGKSTALRYAALSLEREGFTIYFISGPDEFLEFYENGKNQVFVLDDPLGVYSVSQGRVDSWQELNGKIRKALSTNAKLLVSIRTQIFMHESVRDSNIVFLNKSPTTDHVDFSDVEYEIGIEDMRGMLSHYMTVSKIDVNNINRIIKQIWPKNESEMAALSATKRQREKLRYSVGLEFTKCFPLLCKVFVNTSFVRENPVAFFRNPFPALTNVFQKIKSENKHQFCALVLCTIFDGTLTNEMFIPSREGHLRSSDDSFAEDKLEIRNFIMSSYNFKCSDDLQDLQSALNSLTGVYISNIGDTYRISHALFHDIVTYLYNDPIFIFNYATGDFIRDRVRISESQLHDHYIIVYSDDKNIDRLADRLIRDSKSYTRRGFELMIENPNIDDDRLISCLRTKLKDSRQTDKKFINELFIHCMKTVLKKKHIYKDGDVTEYKLIELCVHTGLDCNMDIMFGRCPLFISVVTGSVPLTNLFLHNGADKRKVYQKDYSILHCILRYTKCNKLEIMKLLTHHEGDQSVVRVTSKRGNILYELRRDNHNLLLQEVLSNNSTRILTTNSDEIEHYVKDFSRKIQLVRHLHDNILTFVDGSNRNILHYSVDDVNVTRYLLNKPQLQSIVNDRDKDGRTPYWFVVNDKHPFRKNLSWKLSTKEKQDMMQLYKDNQAVL